MREKNKGNKSILKLVQFIKLYMNMKISTNIETISMGMIIMVTIGMGMMTMKMSMRENTVRMGTWFRMVMVTMNQKNNGDGNGHNGKYI